MRVCLPTAKSTPTRFSFPGCCLLMNKTYSSIIIYSNPFWSITLQLKRSFFNKKICSVVYSSSTHAVSPSVAVSPLLLAVVVFTRTCSAVAGRDTIEACCTSYRKRFLHGGASKRKTVRISLCFSTIFVIYLLYNRPWEYLVHLVHGRSFSLLQTSSGGNLRRQKRASAPLPPYCTVTCAALLYTSRLVAPVV